MPTVVLLLICLLVCSGCRMMQDPIQTKETSVAPSKPWSAPFPLSPDEKILPSLPLPDKTSPLALHELISLALDLNPTTQQAWRSARAAAYAERVAESALYPQVSGSVLVQEEQFVLAELPTDPVTPGVNTDFLEIQQTLTVGYLLWDSGATRAGISAAQQALHAANWSQNFTIQTVMLQVMQNYYNYVSAKAFVVAQKENIKNAQTAYDAASAKLQSGVGSQLDVLQTKTDLINQEMLLVQYQAQVEIDLGILSSSIGISAIQKLTVLDPPMDIAPQKLTAQLGGLVTSALKKRADLASSDADYLSQQATLEQIIALGRPSIQLQLQTQDTCYNRLPLLFPDTQTYTAGLTLTAPIFTGFSTLNSVREARENVATAFAQLQGQYSAVILDVLVAYYNYQTAVSMVHYSEEYLKYAKETLKAALIGYQEGKNSLLYLLLAQATFANAQAQLVLARTNWYIGVASLAYAMGTLEAP